MKKITHGKIFLKGLAFSLPIALSIGILVWGFRAAEGFLAKPLVWLLPSSIHFPGMGLLVACLAIYLLGLLIHGRMLAFLFHWIETTLSKIPLFSMLYDNIKELTEFMSGAKDDDLERVVLVTMDGDAKLMGFVTRQHTDVMGADGERLHAVYMPMSYQMGGYTLYLPESRLENLDISTQEAMQRILTADISGGNKSNA